MTVEQKLEKALDTGCERGLAGAVEGLEVVITPDQLTSGRIVTAEIMEAMKRAGLRVPNRLVLTEEATTEMMQEVLRDNDFDSFEWSMDPQTQNRHLRFTRKRSDS